MPGSTTGSNLTFVANTLLIPHPEDAAATRLASRQFQKSPPRPLEEWPADDVVGQDRSGLAGTVDRWRIEDLHQKLLQHCTH